MPVRRRQVGQQRVRSANRVQPDNRQRGQPGQDQKELQNFVVDGRGQPAQQRVGQHNRGSHPDGDADIPAQQVMEDQPHAVHGDAGEDQSADGECQSVDRPRRLVVALLQVLGNGAYLGIVVKRHHHDAEKQHSGDRADPVEMAGHDAVFGGLPGKTEQLKRAQIGGHQRKPHDPGGQGAARFKEVFAAFHAA